jgi:hypothetical protein
MTLGNPEPDTPLMHPATWRCHQPTTQAPDFPCSSSDLHLQITLTAVVPLPNVKVHVLTEQTNSWNCTPYVTCYNRGFPSS